MVREHRARRNPVLARRQPILLWNGQGQQHINAHLLTGRIGRGGHRTFFHYRPAECDGWTRGGWARQLVGRPYGTGKPKASPRCAGVFGPRANRGAPRPQSGGLFEAMHRGQIQGDMDHRHQSGRESSERRSRARSAATLRARGGIRLCGAIRFGPKRVSARNWRWREICRSEFVTVPSFSPHAGAAQNVRQGSGIGLRHTVGYHHELAASQRFSRAIGVREDSRPDWCR